MKKLILSFLALLALTIYLVRDIPYAKAQSDSYLPGRVLVKFKEGTTDDEINRQIKGNKAKVSETIPLIDVYVLQVPKNAEEKIVAAFSHNPNVEFAELDYTAEALLTPSDIYFPVQWGLENSGQTINGVLGKVGADIDAGQAWDISASGAKVAILDTGINEGHSDLSGKVVGRVDYTGSSSGTNDIYGRFFFPTGTAIGNEFRINENITGTQDYP